MKTQLIEIGNSRGIRIPKPLIEQCGLNGNVELRVENGSLVISARRVPRAGWDEKFRAAGPSTNDDILLDLVANEFDREEWRW